MKGSKDIDDHSTTRLVDIVERLDKESFRQITSLNDAAYKLLKRYPEMIAKRNMQAYQSEQEFAVLLMTPLFHNSNAYWQWKPFFQYA